MGQPANQGRTPVRERILDTRGHAQDGDARNVINARRTGKVETQLAVGYYPWWGGGYGSREDRSPTPEPPGTCMFSREIRMVSFPPTLPPAYVDRQVHGGDGPSCVAQRLPPSMLAGRGHHRRGHYPQPTAAPRKLSADLPRTFAGQPDPQLGRLGPHLRGKLPGHIRALQELLELAHMHLEARRVAPGLHTVLLQALYGSPERRPV
jgi:hypothetical protein